MYRVDSADFRFAQGVVVEYAVTVTNETSLTSLFAHAQSVKNVPRDSAFEAAMGEEARTLPYATIRQDIHMYLAPAGARGPLTEP